MLHPNKNLKRNYCIFYTVYFVIFVLFVAFSFFRDPRDFLNNGFAPKDAQYYRYFALGFLSEGSSEVEVLKVPTHFRGRFLYPLIGSMISRISSIDLITSFVLLDLLCCLAIGIICVSVWRIFGLGSWTILILLAVLFSAWNFPVRMSIAWPGAGFGAFYLLPILSFWTLLLIEKQKRYSKIALVLISASASLVRETYLLFILLTILLHVALQIFHIIIRDNKFDFKRLHDLKVYSLLCVLPALIATFFVGIWTRDDKVGYVLGSVPEILWKNSNIWTLLHSTFSAIGIPLMGLIFFALAMKKARSKDTIGELTSLKLFIVAGFIIALFGGAETERYLTWIYPQIAVFLGMALEYIFKGGVRNARQILIGWTLVWILSSRILVPNLPHMFPTNSLSTCSFEGIKTNYDPELFKGLPILKFFIGELRQIDESEISQVNWKGERPFVQSGSLSCQLGNSSPFFNVYKMDVNTVPFPLGFQHNHFEVWGIWPYWTDYRISLVYTIQWIFICMLISIYSVRRSTYNHPTGSP